MVKSDHILLVDQQMIEPCLINVLIKLLHNSSRGSEIVKPRGLEISNKIARLVIVREIDCKSIEKRNTSVDGFQRMPRIGDDTSLSI